MTWPNSLYTTNDVLKLIHRLWEYLCNFKKICLVQFVSRFIFWYFGLTLLSANCHMFLRRHGIYWKEGRFVVKYLRFILATIYTRYTFSEPSFHFISYVQHKIKDGLTVKLTNSSLCEGFQNKYRYRKQVFVKFLFYNHSFIIRPIIFFTENYFCAY